MSAGNVYARGWVPHTCIAMASTVRIFSRNERTTQFRQIGLVQSFKPTDTRKMERARGVGYGDRVAEIVPGTTDVSITVTRMALYEENILESFGYHTRWNKGGNKNLVRTLAHMKNPFDINEVLVYHNYATNGQGPLSVASDGRKFAEMGGEQYTSTWYHDCWINNWARTIEITGNLIYMEDVTIDVTWVSDGIEPAPYARTDIWDTHGLNCNNEGESAFDAGGTADWAPDGSLNLAGGARAAAAGVAGGGTTSLRNMAGATSLGDPGGSGDSVSGRGRSFAELSL